MEREGTRGTLESGEKYISEESVALRTVKPMNMLQKIQK